MLDTEIQIHQSYKLLNNQPQQNNVHILECKYALSQNKHDSTLIELSKQQKDSQQFQKKDDMSFTEKVEESRGRSPYINIHEATPVKFLYDPNDLEALELKIISLESTTGIQLKRGVVLKKCNILSDDQITKRDLRKSKLSCQKRSHRPSANVNCSRLIYMIGFLVTAARNIHGANTVTWEVNTSPVVFGRTLELICNISSPKNICNDYMRTWYGSKSDVLLCQNGDCRNTEKYTERKNDNCSYSLLIDDASLGDIDAYYTCSYGASESKRKLRIEDYDFIRLPKRTDINTSIQQSNTYEILVQMNDVYPKPLCKLTFNEKTFTGEINATSITDSKYLKFHISIIYQVTSDGCGSNFELQCLIGKATNISKEQQLCSRYSSLNDSMETIDVNDDNTSDLTSSDNVKVVAVVLAVFILTIVLATVFFAVFFIFHKSRNRAELRSCRMEHEELRSCRIEHEELKELLKDRKATLKVSELGDDMNTSYA